MGSEIETTTTSSSERSELYIVLGLNHPQRFEAIWQMAEYLLFHGDSVVVCHSANEIPEASKALENLKQKSFRLTQWKLSEESCDFTQAPEFSPNEVLLFVGPGNANLVDTIETLVHWTKRAKVDLKRITTWVDSQQVSDSSNAAKWHECCYYFSDLVILDLFRDLSVGWLKSYREFFEKERYPCIVENTKKGRLQNLQLLMDQQTRRIAQVFDVSDDPYSTFDDDDDEEEEENEVPDLSLPENEPYFERLIDGKRSKVVPDPLK